MLQSEKDKLLHLEEELHQRVIGQDEAIEAAVSYTHLDVYKRQLLPT